MPAPKYPADFRSYLRDVSAKIRALRDELGLTTEEAAAAADEMSPGYWGLVERAVKQPSLQSLFRFAKALGVEVGDLVAVGRGTPALMVKSRHRQINDALNESTAGQARAIAACAKAILALKDDPDLTGTGTKPKR